MTKTEKLVTKTTDILKRFFYTHNSLIADDLAIEIARRIGRNYDLAGRGSLRNNTLIVLADYVDHSRAQGALRFEHERLGLADAIMGIRL